MFLTRRRVLRILPNAGMDVTLNQAHGGSRRQACSVTDLGGRFNDIVLYDRVVAAAESR